MYSLRVRGSRAFSTAAASTKAVAPKGAQWNVIKFVSEDPLEVAKEVPEYSFYQMPDEVGLNPYKQSPLHEKILDVPPATLPNPELKFSKLENGLKIISCDRGGEACSLGLFVNVGSRNENPSIAGVAQMLEMVAYKSTAHLSQLRTAKTFESLGVDARALAGRESISYRADCLRKDMPLVAPLMVGNILYPRLLRWEVAAAHRKIVHYNEELLHDVDEHVNEILHQAAFHNNTLGNPLPVELCHTPHFDEHTLRQHIVDHFAPERITFAACNVDHDDLCKWLMRAFCDYNAVPLKERVESKAEYTGGYRYHHADGDWCHVSLGFHHPGGWNAPDAVALSVYMQLLGGTTGSWENTRLSKLTQGVLEKMPDVASCKSFNNQYSDAGLFGVYATCQPTAVPDYVQAAHAALMAPITAQDVAMAKAQLKTQAEASANDVVDDLGRQAMMTGTALDTAAVQAKIEAVTEAQVKACQQYVSKCKPTVVAHGRISWMPHYDAVCSLFQQTQGSFPKERKQLPKQKICPSVQHESTSMEFAAPRAEFTPRIQKRAETKKVEAPKAAAPKQVEATKPKVDAPKKEAPATPMKKK